MRGSRGDRPRPCGAGAQQLCPRSAARAASKADQDPGTWRPPAQGYRCQYATDWIADKTRWGLSIDRTEHAALSEAAASRWSSLVRVRPGRENPPLLLVNEDDA
ncbi:hypothetical protein ACFVYV_33845, partial [Streptomyces mirabilis]